MIGIITNNKPTWGRFSNKQLFATCIKILHIQHAKTTRVLVEDTIRISTYLPGFENANIDIISNTGCLRCRDLDLKKISEERWKINLVFG
jgi:hypothetical protein